MITPAKTTKGNTTAIVVEPFKEDDRLVLLGVKGEGTHSKGDALLTEPELNELIEALQETYLEMWGE